MGIVGFMVALLIKLCNTESPAEHKRKLKERDDDPSCCLKSNEWYKEHPEGYQAWYDNYMKDVRSKYYSYLNAGEEKKIQNLINKECSKSNWRRK